MCIAGHDLIALCAEWLVPLAYLAATWVAFAALKGGGVR
jgi:hypothetical protein